MKKPFYAKRKATTYEPKFREGLSEEQIQFYKDEIDKLNKSIEALQSAKQPQGIIDSLINEKINIERKLYDIKENKLKAKKIVYGGVEYDSERECNFAKKLESNGFTFTHQVYIELQPALQLERENIKPIGIIVDFLIGDTFLDIKGMITPEFKIKWKMLKFKYQDTRNYITASNKTEMEKAIQLLKIYEHE